ncbi:hypothetical protein MMC30_002135 [Trapelia coarctata]|nr:hypothetical protein [Trapelia coarctata]
MAEKWCLDGLKNQAIDCMRKFYAATRSFVPMRFIVTGYRNTYRNSPLREYLYKCAAFFPYTKEDYFEMQEEAEIVPDVMAYYKLLQRSLPNPNTNANYKFHAPLKSSAPAAPRQAVR